ncbi:hypothetical protein M407DRAFT_9490 [Tulasnella calospora MUT 4182]|uniref:I/LWEQ domain-containing protein n=1 Tax=Tulasnella calospora MUT 4182 TaxID=1051891 RepID=A0A0C3LPH8_9AGAM|nr:hypothetical protein M407DRAFT_9490 [Tulasnella calospora MUT 4182]
MVFEVPLSRAKYDVSNVFGFYMILEPQQVVKIQLAFPLPAFRLKWPGTSTLSPAGFSGFAKGYSRDEAVSHCERTSSASISSPDGRKGVHVAGLSMSGNNRWTEGLMSAAKAVAYTATLLIEGTDGVLLGTHSLEQPILASNEVSSATAQLVAASRVKASLMSKTQDQLEMAARAVTEACKALVRQVKAITAKQLSEDPEQLPDYGQMAIHKFKVREMEHQAEILKLEKELGGARHRLGAMRRAGYRATEEE